MTPLIQAAHDYLGAGLAVIALTGKRPNTKYHPRGLLNTLTGRPETAEDNELLAQAFGDPETTGIGIVIARPYLVIDVDGDDGARELVEIMGKTPLTSEDFANTPVAQTARGLHIWFADWPREWRNTKLGSQLDLKTVGGYVAAPPSVHPSGAVYTWLDSIVNEDGTIHAPMMMPDPLRAWLEQTDKLLDSFKAPPLPERAWVLRDGVFQVETQPASMGALVHTIEHTRAGDRNNILFWAAARAREDGFSRDEALAVLGEAAVAAGLTAQEAKTAIRSGYRSRQA